MDKEFLEFWGNYLLSVAHGKRRMEDVAQWVQQGLRGFEDLTRLFRQAYHLQPEKEPGQPNMTAAWKQAQSAFQEAFQEYLGSLGMISPEKYQAVLDENERLKQKIAEQEKTIERLQNLLRDQGTMDPEEVADKFRRILEKQAGAFQKIVAQWTSTDNDD